MIRILGIICFLTLSTMLAQGQSGYAPPKVPQKYHDDLREAALRADEGLTERAIAEINALIEKYPTQLEAYHQLSRIYYQSGQKDESIRVMESAISLDTASQVQQLYTLARLYDEAGHLEKAWNTYQAVYRYAATDPSLGERALEGLDELEIKRQLWVTDYTIDLVSLSPEINSTDNEALGAWTLDGQNIIFTRLVGEQEDLFIAHYDEKGELKEVNEFPFNSPAGEGAHAISPDGKYLIYTSCDRRDGMGSCDLYLSVFKDSLWQAPINMGPAFNSPAWDGQASFGIDGKSIYFSSSRPGGHGGRDIWYVHEISTGKWSKPINAGSGINTQQNEESPFIHFDGKTLYFMRDGKHGLGGYDLYISRKSLDGKWQVAENMKPPINSAADEGALSVHPDGKQAMITRRNNTGKNDLYTFILPGQFASNPVQQLNVHFYDAMTSGPVRARLEIFEINGEDTIRISQWSDEKGKLALSLERNKQYGLIAQAENYVMHSAQLDPDNTSSREIAVPMIALAAAKDKPVVLSNIFFETGSYTLLPASEPELHRLWSMLKHNENMSIEIHGHTDNVGSDEDNMVLSEARARSVYDYLTLRGIPASRVSYKGFGETRPVASNDTEAGRKANRRTEFVVIK